MIKVLLTGANGQIGKEIQRTAPDFVKLFSYDKHALNITNVEAIATAFATCEPHFVINAAAYTTVDQAEKEPELAYAINAMGVMHLAEACQKISIPLIHISTDYIFNGEHHQPYIETDVAAPLNVYGKSKWEGELAVRYTLQQHIILRTSWVFGCFGNNFVKTILRLAKDQSQLRIVSDQYGCPTSANDVANVIWQIIKQINQAEKSNIFWGTYHFANMPNVSWCDFAKKILVMAEKYSPLATKEVLAISTADYPTLAKRPLYSALKCQKIRNCFQITPKNWEIALEEVIKTIS